MTQLTGDDLEIVGERPPNFDAVAAAFPAALNAGVMFCYGKRIYNPSRVYITRELLAHEAIHANRQLANFWTGEDGTEYPNWTPEQWWTRYLAEPKFRFSEERFAHVEEYRTIMSMTRNKRQRREYLDAIARRLSGPLYGNVMDYEGARKLIEEQSR